MLFCHMCNITISALLCNKTIDVWVADNCFCRPKKVFTKEEIAYILLTYPIRAKLKYENIYGEFSCLILEI